MGVECDVGESGGFNEIDGAAHGFPTGVVVAADPNIDIRGYPRHRLELLQQDFVRHHFVVNHELTIGADRDEDVDSVIGFGRLLADTDVEDSVLCRLGIGVPPDGDHKDGRTHHEHRSGGSGENADEASEGHGLNW